ncbi:anaphase-promoting complex component apc8 [Sarracenia purpurea var. burkii]
MLGPGICSSDLADYGEFPKFYVILSVQIFTWIIWAVELLVGIEQDPAKFTPTHARYQRGSSSTRRRFRTGDITSTPTIDASYVSTPVLEEDNEAVDSDFYLLAKSYFSCREYRRAAHVLRDQTGKKAVFLRCYAFYLAGEKRKEEETIELQGPLGKSDAVNREWAQCYETEQLHMLDEAIKCYRRAANCNDREAIAVHQLAKLHSELGRLEEAAFYYKKDLERMEVEEREGPNMEKETAKSLLRGMRIARSGLPSMDAEHLPQ